MCKVIEQTMSVIQLWPKEKNIDEIKWFGNVTHMRQFVTPI